MNSYTFLALATMAGHLFIAAVFASPPLDPDNLTASAFSYSDSTGEISNTTATAAYGEHRFIFY
jgi:hypothetical protein